VAHVNKGHRHHPIAGPSSRAPSKVPNLDFTSFHSVGPGPWPLTGRSATQSTWDPSEAGRKPPKMTSKRRQSRASKALSAATSTSTEDASLAQPASRRAFLRTSKRTRPTKTEVTTPTNSAKDVHNQVEKQYRTRLNNQFERLVDVLAPYEDDLDDEGEGPPRKLSKGEVLDRARKRIEALERECSELRNVNDELDEDLQRMRQWQGLRSRRPGAA
jgi:BMFP domain-containing protein YqiC